MLFRAFCALADGAVSPIQSSLRYFRAEYEQHVAEARCPFTGRGPGAAAPPPEPEPEALGPPGGAPRVVPLSEVLR
jgi:NADH-quinone oxidoreductase subunit F